MENNSGSSQGIMALIGPIGAALALVVGLVALVIGFGASGSASDNTDTLAAAQAELTRTKADLATASQSLESLDGAYNQAQAALAVAQASVQATLASLGDGQSGLKDSLSAAEASLLTAQGNLSNLSTGVGNVERELTDTKDDLSAQADTIRDVDRSLDALKNSFTLTRDDVVANKAAVASLQTDTGGLVTSQEQNEVISKYSLVQQLYNLWFNSFSNESTYREMLRVAVVATEDSGLQSTFNALNSTWEVYITSLTDADWNAFTATHDVFTADLARKINDARGG